MYMAQFITGVVILVSAVSVLSQPTVKTPLGTKCQVS